MEYSVNKGAGNPVEFKGLKSQYLFVFAGGLVTVLLAVLFFASIRIYDLKNGFLWSSSPVSGVTVERAACRRRPNVRVPIRFGAFALRRIGSQRR